MWTFILMLIVWAATIFTLLVGAWICYFLLNNKSQKVAAANVKAVATVVPPVVGQTAAQSASIASNQATTTQ